VAKLVGIEGLSIPDHGLRHGIRPLLSESIILSVMDLRISSCVMCFAFQVRGGHMNWVHIEIEGGKLSGGLYLYRQED
jgi:hypothetical protein